ncbi:hypothetical protein [Nocardioides flavescens]|uniref:Uncharacterized protein n=1 Tax=Nocardioides flavescens TaxID=2691959 RepID=A0A6L7EWU7_9ACTN|nr:hypothetical protein [Nocardioides flavescens]MXG88519.1 hypothetical protein [Nocardioides flavescens]
MSLTAFVSAPWWGLVDACARRSQRGAVANARVAATACSRARLERAEVDTWLEARAELAAAARVAARVGAVTSRR